MRLPGLTEGRDRGQGSSADVPVSNTVASGGVARSIKIGLILAGFGGVFGCEGIPQNNNPDGGSELQSQRKFVLGDCPVDREGINLQGFAYEKTKIFIKVLDNEDNLLEPVYEHEVEGDFDIKQPFQNGKNAYAVQALDENGQGGNFSLTDYAGIPKMPTQP